VPSASPQMQRLAALALCGALGVAGLTGCETTQEKAAAQRAESARILKARAKRKHHDADGTKSRTPTADGTKSPSSTDKSARRREGVGKSARREERTG
jgi:hypothetical protein